MPPFSLAHFRTALISLAFILGVAIVPGADRRSCESLKDLSLKDTTITVAQEVSAGEFAVPGSSNNAPFRSLPSFCRVAATLKPTGDSDIKVEIWMPTAGWNNKLQAVGNGGWSGAINYGSMARALANGYATSSTDTGHSGGRGMFALGHPEKLIDFGYRSEHELAVKSKAIIQAFYGSPARYSYWNGCSSGGKQGLMEAQRYPADFDGIVAGAPANYWTHLMASLIWIGQATLKDPAAYIPKEKYAVIHKAALDACDPADGLMDGMIENPVRCRFDPQVLECKGADAPTCLTTRQVEAARKIYAALKNPRTKEEIYPGLEPGSELGWEPPAGGPGPFSIPDDHFKYVVFKNPDWDFRTLNFDEHVALADKLDNGVLNATNPDLKAFASRGGKLIIYHGWNDNLIAPRNAINYYSSVMKITGSAATSKSVRLFMVPGMGHCGGGDGLNTVDMMEPLEQWVEKGTAPDQVIGSRRVAGKIERTRPLCAYPNVAQYKGSGSIDEAANFTCAAP
jgi:feruloyl esterase